jgi:DNA-binding SARP family transcriptional activator/tetratricopeptide (TPR) repeat protein
VETVTLRGRLLGRMQVTIDDRRPVPGWPRPSARRLVALLLLAPDHVRSRETVAEDLFPHLDPTRASRAVSKALSIARGVLDPGVAPPSVLAADRNSLWIADHVRVEVDLLDLLTALRAAGEDPDDRARISRLRDALRETAPPLIDDVYEGWAAGILDELEAARRAARLSLARTTNEVSDWRAVAAGDPADEEACAALVEYHLRAGRRLDAARAVGDCRAALEELGLALRPELATLLDAPHAEPTPGRGRWPLFGRDVELTTILETVRPTAVGRGAAVLVAAPTGMGKTHLLHHAVAALASEGWTVATGTSVRDDRLAPFASLRSALVPHLAGGTSPLVSRVLFPAGSTSSGRAMPPAELAAVADALRAHLDRLAEFHPVLLCLDDLHWADRALQRLVARLAAGVHDRRWALLLAARTDEPTAPVPELPTSVIRLALGPLDPAASASLAAHASDEVGAATGSRARRLAERGRGHPFFIVELARSLPDDEEEPDEVAGGVPERIVELLRGRLNGCSPAARRLTALVAIAGDDATIDLVTRGAGALLGPDVDVADVIDELECASLVHEHRGGFRLDHPLLRDAAEAMMNPVRRAGLHDHIATCLETLGGRPDDTVALAIARHRLAAFVATGGPSHAQAAVPAGLEGARIAAQVGAPDAAMELFIGALEAFDTLDDEHRAPLRHAAFDGWLGLGEVRINAADLEGATAAFATAWLLAATVDERSLAWRWVTNVDYRRGKILRTIARLEYGLAAIPEDEVLARARLLVELGWCRCRRGEHDLAVPILQDAVALSYDAGDWGVLTLALDRYGFALASRGDAEASLPLFDRARAAAVRSGDLHELAITRAHHGVALNLAGRPEEARAELRAAAELADRHGYLYLRSIVHWAAAVLEDGCGEPELALAERDAELALLDGLDNDRHLAGCQAHRAQLLRTLGRDDEASTACEAARAAAERDGDPTLVEEVQRILAPA